MKRMLSAIASLALIASVTPVLADGYNGYNNKNNQFQNWQHNKKKRYYKHHNHNNNNNNNYDAWQVGGAFVGGLILGDILGNQPYAAPPAYGYEVGPQPYYQAPPPVWAAPRYCGPDYRYDEWGRIVQTYGCYR